MTYQVSTKRYKTPLDFSYIHPAQTYPYLFCYHLQINEMRALLVRLGETYRDGGIAVEMDLVSYVPMSD